MSAMKRWLWVGSMQVRHFVDHDVLETFPGVS